MRTYIETESNGFIEKVQQFITSVLPEEDYHSHEPPFSLFAFLNRGKSNERFDMLKRTFHSSQGLDDIYPSSEVAVPEYVQTDDINTQVPKGLPMVNFGVDFNFMTPPQSSTIDSQASLENAVDRLNALDSGMVSHQPRRGSVETKNSKPENWDKEAMRSALAKALASNQDQSNQTHGFNTAPKAALSNMRHNTQPLADTISPDPLQGRTGQSQRRFITETAPEPNAPTPAMERGWVPLQKYRRGSQKSSVQAVVTPEKIEVQKSAISKTKLPIELPPEEESVRLLLDSYQCLTKSMDQLLNRYFTPELQ
ncbi:MAG: hypothetical protein K2X66_05150 [Cyanobacteria bacterium]|nr:hypothetical protein [Cyanobacteriota bacterium]